ncbi:hypothetical protein QOZ80_3AG0223350 [Eleusine coracana subsp. coracana]|nr:hypothetical protein QOZ80_3AG0223350 [Eleusine coracana subsp. coracana]
MKVEGSRGAVPVKRRRREAAAGGRNGGGGVSVRRRTRWRVQADAAPRTLLGRLLAACRVAFGGPGTVPAPADVSLLRSILDKIGPEDVRKFLDAITDTPGPHHSHPIITRTTVYSCRNFSIVIFFLPPKAVIPLHNHPGMTVFSKLLFGSLHVRSYDWVHPDDRLIVTAGNESTNPRNRDSTLPAVKLARLVLDADLSAPCDALVLYPESGGNMHQFAAATPCAVLDVLGPPYSKDRDCTYYQDLPFSNHDPSVDDNDAGDVDATDEKNARLAWLKETDKPQDLKMYEVPYKGPPPIF